MKYVYAVGSWRSDFIVDRIYSKLENAISYCNSRQNDECAWSVMKALIDGKWIEWESVHHVRIDKHKKQKEQHASK